jgi:hypothetical protein
MRTAIPVPVRVAIILASTFAVVGLMLLCSIWSGFVSSDPNPSQDNWLKISNFVALPTRVFPNELPGGLQFLIVFLFWVMAVYFAVSWAVGVLIAFSSRRAASKRTREPIKP